MLEKVKMVEIGEADSGESFPQSDGFVAAVASIAIIILRMELLVSCPGDIEFNFVLHLDCPVASI